MDWEYPHSFELEDDDPLEPPCLEVEVTANPVVAQLYGVDGEILIEIYERPPCGFQLPEA